MGSMRHLPDVFRTKARVYVPVEARLLLDDVAASPDAALCIDVDALERSQLARIDGVTLLALRALHEHLPIALLAWDANERAAAIGAALPGIVRCTHAAPRRSLAPVRSALPEQRLIVITDASDLTADLAGADCALVVNALPPVSQRNVARIRELDVRAMLWWLAHTRHLHRETMKASSRDPSR
jgi:hypothetical protein